jgi:glycosyltransferase involved in cell wall biosynthesis
LTGAPPTVSVVIPAHNAQSFLAECLAGVSSQVGDFELETILVDDGSTDDTARLAGQHPEVRCLSQPNRGPGAARNTGIAAAHGDFIAFLDADDLWPPGKLAMQLQILEQHEDAALVVGDCRQFDVHAPWPRTEFEANGLGTAAWGTGGLVPDAYARLLADNFVTTGSVVLRRAVLADVGGFDEDLRLVEDLELWLRIARRYPIAWCSEVCLLRRRHGANASRDAEAMGLAYLEVLRRQGPADAGGAAPSAATIASLEANEYLHLAELALSQGRMRVAAGYARHSLAARPSIRSLWRLGQVGSKLLAGRGTGT